MINSALCIILIKMLRKLKGNQLCDFQDNLESSNFVFTNEITVTCYFFLGGKCHKLLPSKPGNSPFTEVLFLYLQIETVLSYLGNISLMGVPYKAKGYLDTFYLALEKQCRTEDMYRTNLGVKKIKHRPDHM